MSQKYNSADTSINQIASVYKLKGIFKKGDRVLDYGGGKYDTATEFMADKGVKVFVFDPFNRTPAHNRSVLARFKKNKPDVIVCANVLNVIMEDNYVIDVIRKIKHLAGKNTAVIFSVYEGDKSGFGKPTVKGYQRNTRASGYADFILPYFPNAIRKGNVWYCVPFN